eukprot:m.121050 g.121050  ORF g.121050 m.121050 type:complete len:492 (-) comp11072_c0_seq1:1070-2545(-)
MDALMSKFHAASPDEAIKVAQWLDALASEAGVGIDDRAFAEAVDAVDPLAEFRLRFHMPKHTDGSETMYMCGNSLGLEPKSTSGVVNGELNKWAAVGVKGHFEGDIPWATCEELLPELAKDLLGADDAKTEIAFTNSLTTNLHLLMTAFYRPNGKRNKILIESAAFPSDRYATASHIQARGLDPAECLIEATIADDVKPSTEDYAVLPTERILALIDRHADALALVMLSGIQYITGQFFDIERITAHVHSLNEGRADSDRISIGWDLAHAAGNVPLEMHKWGADFAVFCTYKYINSGAGCLAGLFVHSKHADRDLADLPRLTGWWGVPIAERFKMAHDFKCARGAPSFVCSNVPPILVACVKPSLEVFRDAGGIHRLRRKSLLLTGYLESILHTLRLTAPAALEDGHRGVEIVTPSDPAARGCQLSLRVVSPAGAPAMTMHELNAALDAAGVIADEREPDVIRIAPTPLYNSFLDVFRFAQALQTCLHITK